MLREHPSVALLPAASAGSTGCPWRPAHNAEMPPAISPRPAQPPAPSRPAPRAPVTPQIDDPVELLLACHDKVRHFTGLSERLAAHVTAYGADRQARDAAKAVLRYFEIAAPHHHADEDEDLFPALAGLHDPELNAMLAALSAQHQELGALWAEVAAWLRALTDADGAPPPQDVPSALIARFSAAYQAHAQREEQAVFPHVARLSPEAVARVAAAMVRRRTAPTGR